MIVDLNPMPYRRAMELVRWCFEHNVDRARCIKILEAISRVDCSSLPNDQWVLDVPDKYITYFILKWSSREY